MSESSDIQQQIAELEATLKMSVPESVRQMLEGQLATLKAQQQPPQQHPDPAARFRDGIRKAAPYLAGGTGAFTIGLLAMSGIAPLLVGGVTTMTVAQSWLASMGLNALSGWVGDWALQHVTALLKQGASEQEIAQALQQEIAQRPDLLNDAARLLNETHSIKEALDAIGAQQANHQAALTQKLQFLQALMTEGQRRSDVIQGKLHQQVVRIVKQQTERLVQEYQERTEQLSQQHADILNAIKDLAKQAGVEIAVNVSGGGTIVGPAVGVNLGTIIYGRDPEKEEREHLVRYLSSLAASLYHMPLQGIEEKLSDQGKGMALPAVYTLLSTEQSVEVVRGSKEDLKHYFEDDPLAGFSGEPQTPRLKRDYDPAYVAPDDALVVQQTEQAWRLVRPWLATEAVSEHRSIVLLGMPGSGKSTFVRHLAWTLTQWGLGRLSDTPWRGWEKHAPMLPVVLPLRTLAGRLAKVAKAQQSQVQAVSAAFQAEMAKCDYDATDALGLLRESLQRGVALLLFDGLDEVPIEATEQTADRLTTLQAVRWYMLHHQHARAVVTCRTLAFSDDLRDCLQWPVERLAPFTMGQVRHFVPAWYGEMVDKTDLTHERARHLGDQLITALQGSDQRSEKLRQMAGTPLLLTMMALVLYNKGELPRDRSQLYERILDILLGQWDKMKFQDEQHRLMDLGEAIGRPSWTSDYVCPLLDQLSYDAHATATSEDGRGRLERGALLCELEEFFVKNEMTPKEALSAAQGFLEYIDQRSGLLLPDGPRSYAFAHLTLQEHCAGRHIAVNSDDPIALVMQHRADDRWREPIFLGMGVMTDYHKVNRVLEELLAREEYGAEEGPSKPMARWYRDLILAAELGQDREWAYLRTRLQVRVKSIQSRLQAGLTELLTDPDPPIPAPERIHAAFLLGDLGDPRIPVTSDQWRVASDRWQVTSDEPPTSAHSSLVTHHSSLLSYWCPVPAGTYRIGGWKEGEEGADIRLPAFWVARYALTVAQYRVFIEAGGYQDQRWWTAHGWQWKQRENRTQPWGWDDSRFNGSNQPVIGITWYEAMAFACWLNEQLVLPEGYRVRLPTEAEWEAAAAYDGQKPRRTYPWGNDPEPTTEHAIFDEHNLDKPAPVGCCIAGAAACGALDMAGNVWEWTASRYQSYPNQSAAVTDDMEPGAYGEEETYLSLRGGSRRDSRTSVRGAARYWVPPARGSRPDDGVRLFVSPQPS